MTRELERVLRATFEDRTQPVPQQSDGLADVVIGRARGVRRRRALAGSASALVLVVLAGLGLVLGKMPFAAPEEKAPSGDNLPIPVIQGLDVAVPNPSDKSGPYLQAGDGTRVPLPKDQKIGDALRLPGGFLAITTKDENGTLAYYPTSGPAKEIANGKALAMALDPTGRQVAVTRAEGGGVRLDVYTLDGTVVSTDQFKDGDVLAGWSGDLVMFQNDIGVTAWNSIDRSRVDSPSEKLMRFLGTTVDWSTYVTYEDPEKTCTAKVFPLEAFRVGEKYCYGEIPATERMVSPEGEWVVARGMNGPDRPDELVRTHLTNDLISPGPGSMANLGIIDVQDWLWEDDDSLIYRTSEGWFRLDLYGSLIEPLPIPQGSSAYPVPRAFVG